MLPPLIFTVRWEGVGNNKFHPVNWEQDKFVIKPFAIVVLLALLITLKLHYVAGAAYWRWIIDGSIALVLLRYSTTLALFVFYSVVVICKGMGFGKRDE